MKNVYHSIKVLILLAINL